MEHVVGGDEALREELDRSGALLGDLQHAVIGLRTLPFSSISAPLRRAVRDAAARAGIEVRLELDGSQTALDRTILDGLTDPLVHLLRNAISHGIEMPDERERAGKPREGVVRLSASSRGDRVLVVVADDGRGVSPALLDRAAREGSLVDVLAAPGFSTAAGVDDLSGRGVGLDAVKRHVSGLGGSLEVTSRTGVGTEFTLVLPATLAVLHLLLVERDGQAFGVPLTGVMEAVEVGQTATLGGRATLQLHGEAVPVVDLLDVLGGASAALATGPALIVGSAGHRAAVRCDRLIGDEEAVVKSLGGLLSGLEAYLGAAILGDGRVALICDPGHLARATGRTGARAASHREPAATSAAPRLLVVDDQITIRELQRSILGAAGYDVLTARDGREALDALERAPDVQLVLTDVEMPVLDGFGLLEQIRAHPVHGSLPVIIVSSRGDEADRRRGAEAGADAYVVKSEFDQRSLLATVQRLVGAR
jgi:two-component system chemotaxis sensor kinase CheA